MSAVNHTSAMRHITTFAVSALALAGIATADIESTFHAGYSSQYIFRGGESGDDLFEFGLDFTGACDCGVDWNAGIWYGSYDNAGSSDSELDIYAGISKDLGIGTIGLGYIHYTYAEGASATPNEGDIYLSLSTEYAGVAIGATYYNRIESATSGSDNWFQLSADYSYELSDKAALNLGLGLDFGDNFAANHVFGSASISVDYAISDEITLSPYLATSKQEGTSGNDHTWGGVSVSYAF